MDKKSRMFLKIFLVLMLLSALSVYYRYIILKDFQVIETVWGEGKSDYS